MDPSVNASSEEDLWAQFFEVRNDSERYYEWISAVNSSDLTASPTRNIVPSRHSASYEMEIREFLTIIYSPIIFILGLIGNTATWLIFLRSRLRSLSSSHYLAALVIVNSLYMLSKLIKWLAIFDINFYHRAGWCQFMQFTKNASEFLSVWYLAIFAVERYICICWPAEAPKMCTKTRARVIIIGLMCISIAVYLNLSLIYGMKGPPGHHLSRCSPLPHFEKDTITALVQTDRFINIMLPYLTIFILTILIIYNTCKVYKQRLLSDDPAQIRRVTIVFLCVCLLLQLPLKIYMCLLTLRSWLGIEGLLLRFPKHITTIFIALHDTSLAMHFVFFAISYPMFSHSCKTPFLWLREKMMTKFRKAPNGDIHLRNVRFHAVQEENNVAHV